MKNPILCLMLTCLVQETWATITWTDTVTDSAINENLNIESDCLLNNASLYIVADEANVTVTIKNKSVIQAQEIAQEINLVAIWPYTITIKVEHDLEFRGIEDLETEPLYIYMFGDGEIRWEIKEDKKLRFNKTKTSGPTELWIGLFSGQLRHVFKSSDKKQIFFGPECSIGYSVFNTVPWTTEYQVNSSNYNPSSGKDYPHIVFHEGSKLSIRVENA